MEPGKEYEREDGSIGTYYNAKKLYDISQTTMSERPQPQTAMDERLLIRALINNPPASIVTAEPDQCRRIKVQSLNRKKTVSM